MDLALSSPLAACGSTCSTGSPRLLCGILPRATLHIQVGRAGVGDRRFVTAALLHLHRSMLLVIFFHGQMDAIQRTSLDVLGAGHLVGLLCGLQLVRLVGPVFGLEYPDAFRRQLREPGVPRVLIYD